MAITPRKDERLQLRASARHAELIRQAAEARGQSLTDFMLGSALEAAEAVLADQRVFMGDADQWEAFMAALDAPPAPVPALVELFRDPDLIHH